MTHIGNSQSSKNLKMGGLFLIHSVSCRIYTDQVGISLVTHQIFPIIAAKSLSVLTHQVHHSFLFFFLFYIKDCS